MGHVHIGTQGWNYDAWVGPFYPKGTRPANFLRTYGRAFETVEIDSTFYAIPPAATVEGWAERVPEGFVFALKMPRAITHEHALEGAWDLVNLFLARARLLGARLGPVLIQLGPEFGPSRRAALEGFLPRLPRDIRFAVEFRQASWIAPKHLRLLALAESPTADFAYLRWMGPDRAIEDYTRVVVDRSHEIAEWAVVLAALAARVSAVHAYFNNHYQGHSPASARELQRLLGQRPIEPAALRDQADLFESGG